MRPACIRFCLAYLRTYAIFHYNKNQENSNKKSIRMKRLHAWIQHNLIYETSCYTICESKVSRVPYYVSQMRLGSPKILYLNVPLNAYKSVFLLCNSPPLNSMMTF